MGTNCVPLVADLFCSYERNFILSLSDNNQTDEVKALISTSKYIDDLLDIDNPFFEQSQIYEFEWNKANSFDTEASFLDLDLSKR